MQPTQDDIRVAAYYLWLNFGEEDAEHNWLEAEKHLSAGGSMPEHRPMKPIEDDE